MQTATIRMSDYYESIGWHSGAIIDLQHTRGTVCYCSNEAADIIRGTVKALGNRKLCFIDTGDFHYISFFRMELVGEPFTLMLFDNHTDDQAGALDTGLLSCGNWVKFAHERIPLMKEDDGKLPVFISIDTDVLSKEYARTDWSQGHMTLPELENKLNKLLTEREIIGIDVCGGLTERKGADGEDKRINRDLMVKLEEFFLKKLV